MKILKRSIVLVLTLLAFACQDDEPTEESTAAPTDLTVETDVSTDGSGQVVFTATANNADSYEFTFSDGTSETSTSGEVTKIFTETGLNTYTVTVNAIGTDGLSTSTMLEVEVLIEFTDSEAVDFLTDGDTKTWYWAASEPGHLGVGANNSDAAINFTPTYYTAAPFEKDTEASACMYEDRFIFSLDGETLTYELDNQGQTFFNFAYNSVVNSDAGEDFCADYDTSGQKTVTLSSSESVVASNEVEGQTRGTVMNFSDDGFMGYFIGSSTYEILSLSATMMAVRAVMGNNAELAWYHILTTTPVDQQELASEPEGVGEALETIYNDEIWQDEFEVDGTPDATSWGYDLGDNGWGNNELQNYTNEPENVIVEDGLLRITAIKEGDGYTSARLKSQGLREFTYGRMEVRAKLPAAGGTWPAIWMLGANFPEVGWPDCGEIDIMEHVGNRPDKVNGTLHYPGNFAGNGPTRETDVPGATTEFHDYTVEWSPETIKFAVDNTVYFIFENSEATPFNADFFFILNIAVGGTLGGEVDPNFTESSMEIDYVRVFQ